MDVPKGASEDVRIKYCHRHCSVGRRLKNLGESLNKGRNEEMAEQRNWDQICATAEKLRASAEKK
ncbi:zinc-finger domain-containing protein [Bacillus cereus]|uniref:zinc-finger domain-containing protein n=1 Tax=Bacillus cereus TaxID=1396 RepID=UPI002ADEB3BF|nr:zinc-finger domain-containing protein [Bacillus cereus]MEA1010961.1 zinc-finger domain-containing protein [Bacillus cereus]